MITYIVIGVSVLLLGIFLAISYVKAPPDVAYIITGLKKRVLIGKAGFRIPFFERLDKVSLKAIQVDVKTSSSVPTAEYINVNVDSNVNIQITDDVNVLAAAAKNFLNSSNDYIIRMAREVLEGNMREIIGQMKLNEMVNDRQKFAELVKANAAPDLEAIGLKILNFNVQNFRDDNDVINNLGVDNIEQIRKTAQIAKANAKRDVSIAEAAAAKESNDAKVAAELEIAKKQNDLAIKKANLKKESDIQIAIAEAAKGIEAENQRKTREIQAGDANVAAQEKVIELKEREIAIKEKTLDAEIKKKADAEKYRVQMESDANLYQTEKIAEAELVKRQKNAEAEKFEAERQADAKKAMAEADLVKGQNEASVIEAKGKAEAEAIKLKYLAEAEGLDKKAEAMKKYGDAAKMDLQIQAVKMYFEQLPKIAEAVASGYSKVGSITMYGDQSGQIASGIIDKVAQINDGMTKSLGFDLKSVLVGALGTKILGNKTEESK